MSSAILWAGAVKGLNQSKTKTKIKMGEDKGKKHKGITTNPENAQEYVTWVVYAQESAQ